MEALIGFIGSIIKIGILSTVYAFVILCIFRLIGNLNNNNWFDRVSIEKLKFWLISGAIISVALFCYLFTYWGFHGFGDGPRIPIGYGIVVDNTNWNEYGYLHVGLTSDSMQIEMTKFEVHEDKLIGNLQSGFYDYKSSFFVMELKERSIKEFMTSQDYDKFAIKNNLPLSKNLKTFRENYWDYWGGWRAWLLP